MEPKIFLGIMIPFFGTMFGALCVYFLKKDIKKSTNEFFMGFAGGVMVAASVWSLIIPSVNYSVKLGKLAFFPAAAGLWAGVLFIIILDKFVPCDSQNTEKPGKFFWAVLIHNIPEGMAVGVVFAGVVSGKTGISFLSALILSVGIAIQNFPEGAIISLPMYGRGSSVHKSFAFGILSGVVEPLGAICALFAVQIISPILPYVLGFAAGAMIYVVLEELIPSFEKNKSTSMGNISFAAGFTVMMILDIVLSG